MEIERCAYAEHHAAYVRTVAGDPQFLFRTAEANKHDACVTFVDSRDQTDVLIAGQVAIRRRAVAGDPESRESGYQLPLQRGQGRGRTSQEINRHILLLGGRTYAGHEVRPVDTGLPRRSEPPLHPCHGCPIGQHHVAVGKRSGEARVTARRDGHVDVAQVRRPAHAFPAPVKDLGDGGVPADDIDGHSEHGPCVTGGRGVGPERVIPRGRQSPFPWSTTRIPCQTIHASRARSLHQG